MKRLTVFLITLVMITGAGLLVASPTQGNTSALSGCRSLTYFDDTEPADWQTWIEDIRGYRNGHFWTSNNCPDTFYYWSKGIAFQHGACVEVRLVFYDRSHNFDRQTGWKRSGGCGGSIMPLTITLPDDRAEFSFDVRMVDPDQRMRRFGWSLYSPAVF